MYPPLELATNTNTNVIQQPSGYFLDYVHRLPMLPRLELQIASLLSLEAGAFFPARLFEVEISNEKNSKKNANGFIRDTNSERS